MTTDKQRSEFLATRNSLTRQVAVLPKEEMEAYDAFMRELVHSLAPETAVELQLAQSWATFQWRINRAAALEDTFFTLGSMEQVAENLNIEHAQAHNAATNAKFFRNQAAEFATISLHSQRLINQAEKVFKQLLHIQAIRRQRQQSELRDATAIYKFHRMQGQPFDPQSRGFIVTLDQIKVNMEKRIELTQAAWAQELDWNRTAYVAKYGQAAA